MAQILKKITTKTVCGKVDKKSVINSEGDPIWMMVILGRATRRLAQSSDLGEYIRFKGTFEATNIETGEVFKSMNLIVPPIAEDIIEEGFAAEGVNAVEFALKLGVRRDDDSVSGYQWVAESVKKAAEGDPLAALRSELVEQKVLPHIVPDDGEDEKEPVKRPATKKRAATR